MLLLYFLRFLFLVTTTAFLLVGLNELVVLPPGA